MDYNNVGLGSIPEFAYNSIRVLSQIRYNYFFNLSIKLSTSNISASFNVSLSSMIFFTKFGLLVLLSKNSLGVNPKYSQIAKNSDIGERDLPDDML